jgi:hypothetical protein
MPLAQVLLGLANIAIPEIATFITIFRHKDGSATVITELSEAAAASAATKQIIADWNATHPATQATPGA